MKNTWKTDELDAGQRLDVFLTDKIPKTTRSAIAKKLKNGAALINGKKASVHTFLKADQTIEFMTDEIVKSSKLLQVDTPPEYLPELKKITIKQTPDWILINKPTGLLVHPDAKHTKGTLIDIILEKYPEVAKVGEDPQRPGIVHRLDRDVSGLMVIAKNQNAFDNLKKQFAQRKTKKSYLALVHGKLPQEQGDIKFKIARSKTKPRMAARPANEEEGKAAWTHYKVIKKLKNYTLVELNILSGRTHQIRAHLFALGCPVVGDTLYTQKNPKKSSLKSSGRIMLQSIKLTFQDPTTNEQLNFEIKPDKEFENLMSGLTK